MLTAFGITALVFMMAMYALEQRGPRFTLGFVAGCALASTYGFLSGAWPFGAVEAVWSAVAINRYRGRRRAASQAVASPGRPAPAQPDDAGHQETGDG